MQPTSSLASPDEPAFNPTYSPHSADCLACVRVQPTAQISPSSRLQCRRGLRGTMCRASSRAALCVHRLPPLWHPDVEAEQLTCCPICVCMLPVTTLARCCPSRLWRTQGPKHVQMTDAVCACSLAPPCHDLALPGGLQCRLQSRVRQASIEICASAAYHHLGMVGGACNAGSTKPHSGLLCAGLRRFALCVCSLPPLWAWSRPSRWPAMQHPARPTGPANSMMSLQPGGSCLMQPAYGCGQIWKPCRC